MLGLEMTEQFLGSRESFRPKLDHKLLLKGDKKELKKLEMTKADADILHNCMSKIIEDLKGCKSVDEFLSPLSETISRLPSDLILKSYKEICKLNGASLEFCEKLGNSKKMVRAFKSVSERGNS